MQEGGASEVEREEIAVWRSRLCCRISRFSAVPIIRNRRLRCTLSTVLSGVAVSRLFRRIDMMLASIQHASSTIHSSHTCLTSGLSNRLCVSLRGIKVTSPPSTFYDGCSKMHCTSRTNVQHSWKKSPIPQPTFTNSNFLLHDARFFRAPTVSKS